MRTNTSAQAIILNDRLTYTVNETCRKVQIGRSSLYKYIQSGQLRSLKIGNCRRIAANDLHDWLESFREQAAA